jgi:hypothetical protein
MQQIPATRLWGLKQRVCRQMRSGHQRTVDSDPAHHTAFSVSAVQALSGGLCQWRARTPLPAASCANHAYTSRNSSTTSPRRSLSSLVREQFRLISETRLPVISACAPEVPRLQLLCLREPVEPHAQIDQGAAIRFSQTNMCPVSPSKAPRRLQTLSRHVPYLDTCLLRIVDVKK